MCAVSATIDMWRGRYPVPLFFPPIDYPKYIKQLTDAKELDVQAGEPDCSGLDKQFWHSEVSKLLGEKK